MTEDLVRRKHTGEPGNPGKFGAHARTEAEVRLDAPQEEHPDFEEPAWEPTRSFLILPQRMGEAAHRIDVANRRLERAKIDDRFTYETETEYVKRDGLDIAMVRVTLNEPVLKFDGWQFTGAHDFTPDGSVISHTPGGRTADLVEDAHCDHCGANRRRERVYTLTSEDGETKQVGKSCLSAFLGIRPAGLWALDEDLDLDDLEPNDDMLRAGAAENAVYPAADLLAAALSVSGGGHEFVPRSKATRKDPATADVVKTGWSSIVPSDEDKANAAAVLDWLAEQPDDNDYMQNLKAVLITKPGAEDSKWVKSKHVAIATSAVGSWRRSQIVREQKARLVQGYLAGPKEVVQAVPAKVQRVHSVPSDYGYNQTLHIVTLITDDGHAVVWKTQSAFNFDRGDTVVIDRATVKANEIYSGGNNDIYQTVVIRPKFTVVERGTDA